MKINRLLLPAFILFMFSRFTFIYPENDDSITELKKIVQDTSYGNYWDRREAIPKLAKIGSRESTAILMELLGDAEPPIQESAVAALAKLEDTETINWFAEKSLNHQNQQIRTNSAWVLKLLKTETALPFLLTALKKNNGPTRAKIIEALSYMPASSQPEIFEAISGYLMDSNPLVRTATAEALGRIKNPNGYEILLQKRLDSDWLVRAKVLEGLALIDPAKAKPELEKALSDNVPQVRIAALESLALIDKTAGWAAAMAALSDKEWAVRATAIVLFREFRDKQAIQILNNHLSGEKWRLRYDIAETLKELTKIDAQPDQTVARFFDIPVYGQNIIFIIDFSGSMKNAASKKDDRTKIELAQKELEQTLSKFKPEQKFNIILMSTEAVKINKRNVAPRLVPAVDANKKQALQFVSSIWDKLEDLKRGRGDMYDALMEAFEEENVDTVFILSDGKPTYGQYVHKDNFIENLRKNNRYRKIIVHTILTGQTGTDASFMKEIAESTGGMFVKK